MVTQRKWIVGPKSKTNIYAVVDLRLFLIARCAGQHTKKEHIAHARLIAAAPLLLEVCKGILEDTDGMCPERIASETYDKLESAIAATKIKDEPND